MAQIEFEVTTDLTPITNTQITTNFEAVKEWLSAELAPYASMVVTPDAIPGAKKTRAEIRKVGDSIDSQRKAIKRLWMKPYEDYEAQCKQLTGIVGEAVANIDGQIKAMENEAKEQKRHRLESLFIEKSVDISDYISFDGIFDSRWLNATYNEIDAANDIVRQIETVRESLAVIRNLGSPYEAAMLSEFSKTHSLPKAMQEGKRLEAIQKAEEERKAKEAADAFEQAEVEPQEESEEAEPVISSPPQFVRPVVEEQTTPKLYTLRFEVEMTRDQAFALKKFFGDHHIKYKKI